MHGDFFAFYRRLLAVTAVTLKIFYYYPSFVFSLYLYAIVPKEQSNLKIDPFDIMWTKLVVYNSRQ